MEKYDLMLAPEGTLRDHQRFYLILRGRECLKP